MTRVNSRLAGWIILCVLLCSVDFYNRLYVTRQPFDSQWTASDVALTTSAHPAQEFLDKLEAYNKPLLAGESSSVSGDDEALLANKKFKLLAIYAEEGLVAVLNIVDVISQQQEVIRVTQGEYVGTVQVVKLNARSIQLQLGTEQTELVLFKPKRQ